MSVMTKRKPMPSVDEMQVKSTVDAALGLDNLARSVGGGSVDGGSVLDEVMGFCLDYIAYPDGDSPYAHALWIGHTWLADLLFTTPRLCFTSPEKRSGKTRAEEVTSLFVPNPVNVVSVSPAYLFRKIQDKPDGHLPCIGIDEVDALFTGKPSESTEQIRGILNAGYRKGATVGRAEATRNGDVNTVEMPVFAPVYLAGIGDMPDTVADRSIIVHMKRRRPDCKLQPYRERTAAKQSEPIRAGLAAWSDRVRPILEAYEDKDYPVMPDSIQDRDADVWEPLFIVAQLAGGKWPEIAASIAPRIVAAQHTEPQSIGERLLRDIRDVFGESASMFRMELIGRLQNIDGSPWRTLGRTGDGIDSNYLTKTLRKYDVARDYGGKAHSIRINGVTNYGYYRSDFTDAWSRYLPEPVNTPL